MKLFNFFAFASCIPLNNVPAGEIERIAQMALDKGQVLDKITRRGNQLSLEFSEGDCKDGSTDYETTEPPMIDPVIYHKSDDLMTYDEAIEYCNEQDMELAFQPNHKNPYGEELLVSSITSDLVDPDITHYSWFYYPNSTCSALRYNQIRGIMGSSHNLDNDHHAALFPDGCETKLQAICMSGEYQTTTYEMPTSTRW
ncbi:Oidioi.mRNA.OKI2018_I69.PAR.g8648.t1.cds [Oikopleura dioica]|uniref:Oidioi.mRNA.OKI2018_I69.PAR.g8648.t1.cds n=1 Tax=Oikopleura dioica TaxID=34765 RepID=A0ABN7RKI5_OIKDI|nr:Oidioi.mRNA.OKI2018_I69.PAR.g8648.t1.cds [Oikopleura dioica]